jgi:hypothetical protein
MIALISGAILLVPILLIGNYWLNRRALKYLNEHLDKTISYGAPEIIREVKEKIKPNTALALTVDALSHGYYDWLKVDDRAVDAIKFALGAGDKGFEEIYMSASRAADNVHAFSRIKGYVGEQIAAKDLAEQGFVVSFPDSHSQQGYDLIVDGAPIQVKTTLVETHIQKALETHPGIPVLAPIELLDTSVAGENVIFSPNFSDELAEHITRDSVEAITDLGMQVPIPILTVSFIGYRKIKEICNGKDVKQALVEGTAELTCITAFGSLGGAVGMGVGTYAAAAGIGSAVSWGSAAAVGGTVATALGTKLGGKYGLLAGGAAFLVLGPLGAVAVATAGTLGGAVIGGYFARKIATKWKLRGHMEVIEPLIASARRCKKLIIDGLDSRLDALRKKRKKTLSKVIVPEHRRADRLLKKRLVVCFAKDEARIQSILREVSSKSDLYLQNMGPFERISKTHEMIEATLNGIKENPIFNSQDLEREAKVFLKCSEAFYSLLKERQLVEQAQ